MMEGISLNNLNAELGFDRDRMQEKYLTFWTDGQLYAVPILKVEQIIGMQDITSVPDYPDYMKGVINIRGTMIPVLDFRMRLGKAETSYNDHTCIIVMNCREDNEYMGFIVDGVEEVMDVADEKISVPPKMEGNAEHKFVTGIVRQDWGGKERLILCVDPVKVLGADVLGEISQIIK